MNRGRVLGIAAVVLLVVTATVVLLSTGGSQPVGSFLDGSGDTALVPGDDPPAQTALADITKAEVRNEGAEIVFEISLGQDIPTRIKGENLEIRWDVTKENEPGWIVAVNFDLGPVASVSSQVGGNDYLASTSARTFPGSLDLAGQTITVHLVASEVPGFPTDFNWVVITRLDGAPGDAASATVGDRVPDAGSGDYPS